MDATVQAAVDADVESASITLGSPSGSNFEGPFDLDRRLGMIELMVDKWHDVGVNVHRISFSDAMGWNAPHTVKETRGAVRDRWPEIETFHMHRPGANEAH